MRAILPRKKGGAPMKAFPFPCKNKSKWVSYRRALPFVGLCFGLLLALPAHSQTQGRISGIVTDTSGGAVSGATITVTDVGRGTSRTVTTDSTGSYSAPNLTQGTYSVRATFAGFEALDRRDVSVGDGGDRPLASKFQPGGRPPTVP